MTVNELNAKLRDTYETVYNSTDSFKQSINPEDVDPAADSWSEVPDGAIEAEIHTSINVIDEENQYMSMIRSLAIKEWLNDMPRVNMEHLVFETHEEALKHDYWPYDLSYLGAEAKLHNMVAENEVNVPRTAQNRARSVVTGAIADKLDPRVEQAKPETV